MVIREVPAAGMIIIGVRDCRFWCRWLPLSALGVRAFAGIDDSTTIGLAPEADIIDVPEKPRESKTSIQWIPCSFSFELSFVVVCYFLGRAKIYFYKLQYKTLESKSGFDFETSSLVFVKFFLIITWIAGRLCPRSIIRRCSWRGCCWFLTLCCLFSQLKICD